MVTSRNTSRAEDPKPTRKKGALFKKGESSTAAGIAKVKLLLLMNTVSAVLFVSEPENWIMSPGRPLNVLGVKFTVSTGRAWHAAATARKMGMSLRIFFQFILKLGQDHAGGPAEPACRVGS